MLAPADVILNLDDKGWTMLTLYIAILREEKKNYAKNADIIQFIWLLLNTWIVSLLIYFYMEE